MHTAFDELLISLACDYAEAVLPYLTAEQALPFYMAVREILRMYATAASSETFVQQGRVAEDGRRDQKTQNRENAEQKRRSKRS